MAHLTDFETPVRWAVVHNKPASCPSDEGTGVGWADPPPSERAINTPSSRWLDAIPVRTATELNESEDLQKESARRSNPYVPPRRMPTT
jgi:hypothetical protein